MTKKIINISKRFAQTSLWPSRGILGILAISAIHAQPLHAQDDLASLRAQLKSLEAKVEALETNQKTAAGDEVLKEKLEKLPSVTLDSKGLNFSTRIC